MKACFWIGSSSFGSRFEESLLLTALAQSSSNHMLTQKERYLAVWLFFLISSKPVSPDLFFFLPYVSPQPNLGTSTLSLTPNHKCVTF